MTDLSTPQAGQHGVEPHRVHSTRRGTAADQIKDFILTERLHPGDPLPTEPELCDLLGVSRSSVREAVRTLATLGIVEVRHGTGTFVGQMSLDALVETLVFRGVLSPGDDRRALREVVQVRLALDLATAQEVTQALGGTQEPALRRLVRKMEERAELGAPFPDLDRQFHIALLDHVDNSLVGQLVGAFWDVHNAVLPRLGVTAPRELVATANAHRALLEAAESGDVDAYREAVQRHYEPISAVLADS